MGDVVPLKMLRVGQGEKNNNRDLRRATLSSQRGERATSRSRLQHSDFATRRKLQFNIYCDVLYLIMTWKKTIVVELALEGNGYDPQKIDCDIFGFVFFFVRRSTRPGAKWATELDRSANRRLWIRLFLVSWRR